MSDEDVVLEGNDDAAQAPEASFLQFLSGMGAQTLMHLGKMNNPMTGESTVDLVNAKYSIDLLGIFEEKTKGNLSEEENEYLSNMLTQLRLSYVDVVEGEAGVKIKPSDPPAETSVDPA